MSGGNCLASNQHSNPMYNCYNSFASITNHSSTNSSLVFRVSQSKACDTFGPVFLVGYVTGLSAKNGASQQMAMQSPWLHCTCTCMISPPIGTCNVPLWNALCNDSSATSQIPLIIDNIVTTVVTPAIHHDVSSRHLWPMSQSSSSVVNAAIRVHQATQSWQWRRFPVHQKHKSGHQCGNSTYR